MKDRRNSMGARDVRRVTIGKITVEMTSPAVSADGSQWPRSAMVRYRTPAVSNGSPITVIGNFVPATFRVTGWRYPIEFTTETDVKNFQQIKIDQFIIQAGGENSTPLASTELLRDLPVGRILKAAAIASSFVAKVKPRPINLPNKTIYPQRGYCESASRLDIVLVGADIPAVDLFEMTTGTRKTKRENKPPYESLTALREIAKWYKAAPPKDDRGGKRLNEWIATQTGGNKNTIQQQIHLAVEHRLIPQSKRPYKPSQKRGKRIKK